jgi:4-hydroxy-2-oxoheptanedioate aldolase
VVLHGNEDLTADALFIGPNDLALGFLGYAPPKWDEPAYLALIDRVVAACKKVGKPVGILMPDGEKAKWAKEKWGIQILALGGDVKALQLWMGAQLGTAKQ